MATEDDCVFIDDFEEIYSSRVKFPTKLWKIINSSSSKSITWSDFGQSITINNALFQAEYLDCQNPVFKTKNMTSFVRQLNMYGFRKIQTNMKNPSQDQTQVHKFRNKDFQYGRPDLLGNVKRRCVALKKPTVTNEWKLLVSLQNLRKQFEECLLHTQEFLDFWNIPKNSLEFDLSLIEPKYRLVIIPAYNLDFHEDGETFTAEIPEEFQQYIVDGDLEEPSDSDNDGEETDEGCDLEVVELSTVASETNDNLFLNDTYEDIVNVNPVDSFGEEEEFYASLTNSFTTI